MSQENLNDALEADTSNEYPECGLSELCSIIPEYDGKTILLNNFSLV